MAINTNITALPGGRVFSYHFWSDNRCAFNFFLKHLRVKASCNQQEYHSIILEPSM